MERTITIGFLGCGNVGGGVSVSYTHLDVYKRQDVEITLPMIASDRDIPNREALV